MTSAAVALQKSDMPLAVEALNRARAAFSPEQFGGAAERLFFPFLFHRPEMSAFGVFTSARPPSVKRLSMDYFLDP